MKRQRHTEREREAKREERGRERREREREHASRFSGGEITHWSLKASVPLALQTGRQAGKQMDMEGVGGYKHRQ